MMGWGDWRRLLKGRQIFPKGGFGPPARTVGYGLDNGGNRTSVNDSVNGNIGYTSNNLNQYDQTSNGSQHEISAYSNVSYGYLADTYLATVSSASAGTYNLGYDALGRCVKRTTNDADPIYYAYDGVRSIRAYTVGGFYPGGVYSNTVYGLGVDEIIGRGNNGTSQFLLQDRLGSTSAVTGINGDVIEQYRYDVFGTPEVHGPPVPGDPLGGTALDHTMINNRYLFAGREWVADFGFYENRARAYHPGLGRFMSEDPMGFAAGDTNLFRYCGNDPVNFFDPSGMDEHFHTPPRPPDASSQDLLGAFGKAMQGGYTGGSSSYGQSNGVGVLLGEMTDISGYGNGGGVGMGYGSGLGAFGSFFGVPALAPGEGRESQSGDGRSRGSGSGSSGGVIVPWWPRTLEFPHTTPATPEQIAWTNAGRTPTLIAAGVIFAPLAIPEAAAPLLMAGANVIGTGANAAASWGAYQIFLHPEAVVVAQSFAYSYYGLGVGASTTYSEGLGEFLSFLSNPYGGP